jgi:cell division protein FtsL
MNNFTALVDEYWYLIVGLLLSLLLGSALSVVYTAFENRQLNIALSEAAQLHSRLEVEYGRLLLEESTWSSPAQIEKFANQQLNMQVPSQQQIVVVPANQKAGNMRPERYKKG